jgi:hypothetical protein
MIFWHCYFIEYSSSTGSSDHCAYLIWLSIPCFHWDMAVGLYRYGLLWGSRSPMLWALTKWFSDIAILLNILLLQAVLTIVHTSFGFQFHVFTEIWPSPYVDSLALALLFCFHPLWNSLSSWTYCIIFSPQWNRQQTWTNQQNQQCLSQLASSYPISLLHHLLSHWLHLLLLTCFWWRGPLSRPSPRCALPLPALHCRACAATSPHAHAPFIKLLSTVSQVHQMGRTTTNFHDWWPTSDEGLWACLIC